LSDYSWKILIVDDEPEIHTVTKLVLGKENILGHNLEFIDAMNGEEAKEILRNESDIAMILLDVVMTTENEGLNLVRWIRNDLRNHLVRIVLRTGHPGEAPEMEVITGYDINDYKEKSELTSKKLRTLFFTCLRNFRDISMLEQSRKGLVRVISSLADLYIHPSLEDFTGGVLEQVSSYLFLEHGAMYGISSGLGAFHKGEDPDYRIVAATGEYADCKGCRLSEIISPELRELTENCRGRKTQIHEGDVFVQCMEIPDNGTALLILKGISTLLPEDIELLNIFSENAAMAFQNLAIRHECFETEESS